MAIIPHGMIVPFAIRPLKRGFPHPARLTLKTVIQSLQALARREARASELEKLGGIWCRKPNGWIPGRFHQQKDSTWFNYVESCSSIAKNVAKYAIEIYIYDIYIYIHICHIILYIYLCIEISGRGWKKTAGSPLEALIQTKHILGGSQASLGFLIPTVGTSAKSIQTPF